MDSVPGRYLLRIHCKQHLRQNFHPGRGYSRNIWSMWTGSPLKCIFLRFQVWFSLSGLWVMYSQCPMFSNVCTSRLPAICRYAHLLSAPSVLEETRNISVLIVRSPWIGQYGTHVSVEVSWFQAITGIIIYLVAYHSVKEKVKVEVVPFSPPSLYAKSKIGERTSTSCWSSVFILPSPFQSL